MMIGIGGANVIASACVAHACTRSSAVNGDKATAAGIAPSVVIVAGEPLEVGQLLKFADQMSGLRSSRVQ